MFLQNVCELAHGIISLMILLFIGTAVRISDPTNTTVSF
jgi:hypothetical protein